MTKEITAKELAAFYDGILVDVNREDTYSMAIDLSRARITYDEDFEELVFAGEGYEITFSLYGEFNSIEAILYNEETQETTISFSEFMPDITIRKAYIPANSKEGSHAETDLV